MGELGGPSIYPFCSPWIGVSRIIFISEEVCLRAGGHCFERSWDKRELEENPQAQRCKHCNTGGPTVAAESGARDAS